MATKRVGPREDGADRIIDSLAEAERAALEAVRRFLDTVNGAFPDVGPDGEVRQRVIDSAFRMTEELVGTSSEFAHRLVRAGVDASGRTPASRAGARKAPSRRAGATRAPARKAPARTTSTATSSARKAAARKAPARKAPAARTGARKATAGTPARPSR